VTTPSAREAAAEKFATSEHVDNDLEISTRYPNIRFTHTAGWDAAVEHVLGLLRRAEVEHCVHGHVWADWLKGKCK
jgi:hypothetical protein